MGVAIVTKMWIVDDQLANNRKEFEDEINTLQRNLPREVDESLDNLTLKMKAEKGIHQLAQEMDNTLRRKVQETIKMQRSENLGEEAIEEIFKKLWAETGGEILCNAHGSQEGENIEATVQAISSNERRSHNIPVMRADGQDHLDISTFVVKKMKHMKERNLWRKATYYVRQTKLDEQDVERLQDQSENIIEAAEKHYNLALSPEGQQFNRSSVEELFKDVIKRINEVKDERFKITKEYKMDILRFIEKKATSAFTEMHMKYYRENSPEALLNKKKKVYYALFKVQMQQGDFAVAFCNAVLKKIILTTNDEQLSCTELLHVLRQHPDEIFSDIKPLQAWIMKDLVARDNFSTYKDYINKYEGYVKNVVADEAEKFLTKSETLSNIASGKLENILAVVRQAVNEALEDATKEDSFTDLLLKRMDTLKIPYKEIGGWTEGVGNHQIEEIPEKDQFAAIILQQLDDSLKTNIQQTIVSWNISEKLKTKGFSDFVYKEIVGCTARCPFCKIPCDAHSGGKKKGKHSAHLHRPIGLGGYRYVETSKLNPGHCCSLVSSKEKFQFGKDEKSFIPFKKYGKVHPDWNIQVDMNPDCGKYWKWVLVNYNQHFADYYNAEKADVPIEWTEYTKEEATEDVSGNPVRRSRTFVSAIGGFMSPKLK